MSTSLHFDGDTTCQMILIQGFAKLTALQKGGKVLLEVKEMGDDVKEMAKLFKSIPDRLSKNIAPHYCSQNIRAI